MHYLFFPMALLTAVISIAMKRKASEMKVLRITSFFHFTVKSRTITAKVQKQQT